MLYISLSQLADKNLIVRRFISCSNGRSRYSEHLFKVENKIPDVGGQYRTFRHS